MGTNMSNDNVAERSNADEVPTDDVTWIDEVIDRLHGQTKWSEDNAANCATATTIASKVGAKSIAVQLHQLSLPQKLSAFFHTQFGEPDKRVSEFISILVELRKVCNRPADPPASDAKSNELTAPSDLDDRLDWTPSDGPKQWAKLFNFSTQTFKRRCAAGKIRHRKLSSKSYQIAIADIPAKHQSKFRNAENQSAK
jgi:hypothetical protein